MKSPFSLIDKRLLLPLLFFVGISIITIYCALPILPAYLGNLAIKQFLWYLLGFLLAFIIVKIGGSHFYDSVWLLYGLGIVSLVGLFIFGSSINDARCWYSISGIGTIQPSEFMKIILIITNAVVIDQFHNQYPNPTIKEEFLFLLKLGIIILVPSILTFLQPDTGVVLIYLLITLFMLFISGIRYRWFGLLLGIILLATAFVLALYFINTDLLIDILGTDFFLRIDRILDWSNKSGFQLENGLASIGSGGFLGYGLSNTPLYFPEAQTDFIFAVYASNFGYLGSIILLAVIGYFDYQLIQLAKRAKKNIHKFIIIGIVGMLLYQQLQNIGMTFGLMPITGITLPFISYGGSSLLSYMIMMGFVFSISDETFRYTN